jgi:predicted lipase
MKVSPPKALSFLYLIALHVGLTHVLELADADQAKPYSEIFPSFNDVVSMARLSNLVYDFGSDRNFTCADFTSDPQIHNEDISCELYTHDYDLGTQVLLVSNKKEKYIAVIFAGTDDIKTSLEDTNILTKKFGNNSTRLTKDTDQRYKKAKVHRGFNNAVFTHGIWERIHSKTQDLLQKYPSYSLWTTGHSLGGANAILAAIAFASSNQNQTVLSVSFGCPQIGNRYWRDYFNSTSPLTNNLGIWRVVLAWDLVPRLPQFFTRK